MHKRKALIISIVLALFAAVLLQAYLTSLEKKYRMGARPIDVLIARGYITERTLLTEHLVTSKKIPAEHVAPKALTNVNQLWDKDGLYIYSTVVPLEQGEQITTTKLITPGRVSGISVIVPDGKRAITIPIDAVTGVAELIMPGNRVDVLVTLEAEPGDPSKTVTLFQNVTVLAVRDSIMGEPKKNEVDLEQMEMGVMPEEVAPTVTLALSPGEAQILAHALGSGVIRLTARSLADNMISSLTPSTRGSLR